MAHSACFKFVLRPRTRTVKCGPTRDTPLYKSCWDCKYYNNVDDVCNLFLKEPAWYARSDVGHCGPDGFFFLNNQTSDYIRTHHHVVDK